MSGFDWGWLAIILAALATAGVFAWMVFAMTDAAMSAPTGLERMQACLDAGGDWYWKNDWVGYVCEATR